MGQVIRTSIGFIGWPELDQNLWQSATTKGDFLSPDGRAAKWVPETKLQVEKGYGKWVYYLTLASSNRPICHNPSLLEALFRAPISPLYHLEKGSRPLLSQIARGFGPTLASR